jgi:hypothetical protein
MYGDHMDGTDWAAMGLWMVFLLVIVLVVVWAITRSYCWPGQRGDPGSAHGPPPPPSSPRDLPGRTRSLAAPELG